MKKILLITNSITLILLLGILIIHKYPQRVYRKAASIYSNGMSEHPPRSFLANHSYKEITDFYKIYSGGKNIVMFGNSLVYRISWNELLNRTDVANRGIGGDITEGYINRINYVLNVKPKICFIEGGINDIVFNVKTETTINNLDSIVDVMLSNNVIPVLNCVTYVAKSYENSDDINTEVDKLNLALSQLAQKRKIYLININPKISDGHYLGNEFAVEDGIHYSAKTYLIWKEEIIKVLQKESI